MFARILEERGNSRSLTRSFFPEKVSTTLLPFSKKMQGGFFPKGFLTAGFVLAIVTVLGGCSSASLKKSGESGYTTLFAEELIETAEKAK